MLGSASRRPSRPPVPEPDHVFFAIDDLERQIRPDPADDHVQRVGADVDGRDAHGVTLV